MIKPLHDYSFLPYGIVDRFRKEPNRELNSITIDKRTEVPIYTFAHDTVWDYVDGMTILVIKDNDSLRQYYLDRAVTIYAGVCFGFYALGSRSTVAGDVSLIDSAECMAVIDAPRGSFQPSQLQIFTLFHQVGQDGLFFRGEQHLPLELVYVEKGILHNYCDGREFILHPGEMLIFGSNQWHMQFSNENTQFLTISFLWEEYDFSHLLNRISIIPAEIQRNIDSLLQEYEQALLGHKDFLEAQIKLLLLQILRMPEHGYVSKKPLPASERIHRSIIDKAMRVVSEEIYHKITVTDLARAASVSTSQLTALFKNYLGMTPAKYITYIRLEESKNLLSNAKMSIGEIADLLGYRSIQHFSKQFRSWHGYAPSIYLQKEDR